MRLHNLKPNEGSRHRRKRLGSGESSGLGKTCGKGHKGQRARSGGSIRIGFEGGQMPLHRRLPKKGFNNVQFARKVAVVNVGGLERAFESGATVDAEALRQVGLIRGQFDAVKILGNGRVTKSLTLRDLLCSASAREKIEQAGGSIEAQAADA